MAASHHQNPTTLPRSSECWIFKILFEVQRFEFWTDFRYNGMKGNLWVSSCLVRDLKPVRWEFVSENRLGAGAIRNRAFHPCFTIGTQR